MGLIFGTLTRAQVRRRQADRFQVIGGAMTRQRYMDLLRGRESAQQARESRRRRLADTLQGVEQGQQPGSFRSLTQSRPPTPPISQWMPRRDEEAALRRPAPPGPPVAPQPPTIAGGQYNRYRYAAAPGPPEPPPQAYIPSPTEPGTFLKPAETMPPMTLEESLALGVTAPPQRGKVISREDREKIKKFGIEVSDAVLQRQPWDEAQLQERINRNVEQLVKAGADPQEAFAQVIESSLAPDIARAQMEMLDRRFVELLEENREWQVPKNEQRAVFDQYNERWGPYLGDAQRRSAFEAMTQNREYEGFVATVQTLAAIDPSEIPEDQRAEVARGIIEATSRPVTLEAAGVEIDATTAVFAALFPAFTVGMLAGEEIGGSLGEAVFGERGRLPGELIGGMAGGLTAQSWSARIRTLLSRPTPQMQVAATLRQDLRVATEQLAATRGTPAAAEWQRTVSALESRLSQAGGTAAKAGAADIPAGAEGLKALIPAERGLPSAAEALGARPGVPAPTEAEIAAARQAAPGPVGAEIAGQRVAGIPAEPGISSTVMAPRPETPPALLAGGRPGAPGRLVEAVGLEAGGGRLTLPGPEAPLARERFPEARIPRSPEQVSADLRALFREGAELGGDQWYVGAPEAFQRVAGEDANVLAGLIAAASPNTAVVPHTANGLAVYRLWASGGRDTAALMTELETKAGLKLHLQAMGKGQVLTGNQLKNVGRALRGEPLSGNKVSNFQKALMGDSDAVVIDTYMLKPFGLTEKIGATTRGDYQYGLMADSVRSMAAEMGVSPSTAQAAIWTGIKARVDAGLAVGGRTWGRGQAVDFGLATKDIEPISKLVKELVAKIDPKNILFKQEAGRLNVGLSFIVGRAIMGAVAGGAFGEDTETRIRNAFIGAGIGALASPKLIENVMKVLAEERGGVSVMDALRGARRTKTGELFPRQAGRGPTPLVEQMPGRVRTPGEVAEGLPKTGPRGELRPAEMVKRGEEGLIQLRAERDLFLGQRRIEGISDKALFGKSAARGRNYAMVENGNIRTYFYAEESTGATTVAGEDIGPWIEVSIFRTPNTKPVVGDAMELARSVLRVSEANPGVRIVAIPSGATTGRIASWAEETERLERIYRRFGFSPVPGRPSMLELTQPEKLRAAIGRRGEAGFFALDAKTMEEMLAGLPEAAEPVTQRAAARLGEIAEEAGAGPRADLARREAAALERKPTRVRYDVPEPESGVFEPYEPGPRITPEGELAAPPAGEPPKPPAIAEGLGPTPPETPGGLLARFMDRLPGRPIGLSDWVKYQGGLAKEGQEIKGAWKSLGLAGRRVPKIGKKLTSATRNEHNEAMLKALHGEGPVPEGAQGYFDEIQKFLRLHEARTIVDYPALERSLLPHYFPRGWKNATEKVNEWRLGQALERGELDPAIFLKEHTELVKTGKLGPGAKPGTLKHRTLPMTFTEALEQGWEPVSWRAADTAALHAAELADLRYSHTIAELWKIEKRAIPSSAAPKHWEVPKYPAFDGTGYVGKDGRPHKSTPLAVSPEDMDWLRGIMGTRMEKGADTAAYLTSVFKRTKVLMSFFQHLDYNYRLVNQALSRAAMGHPEELLILAAAPKAMAGTFFPGLRPRLWKGLLKDPAISEGVEEGLQLTAGLDIFKREVQFALRPDLVVRAPLIGDLPLHKLPPGLQKGLKPAQDTMNGIYGYFAEGLFDAAAPQMMGAFYKSLRREVIRAHPELTSRQASGLAAHHTNIMMSNIPDWQSLLGKWRQHGRAVAFSINETEAWFRNIGGVFNKGSLPGTRGAYVRQWAGFMFGTLAFAEMFNYAMTGKFLSPEQMMPLKVRDEEGKWQIPEYNTSFARPRLDGDGPLGRLLGIKGGPILDDEGNPTGDYRHVYVDLLGQADTPFRVFDPPFFAMSRLSTWLSAGIQLGSGIGPWTAKEYYSGKPLGDWKSQTEWALKQLVVPISVMSLTGEEKERIGTWASRIQAAGQNVSAERLSDIKDRAFSEVGPDVLDAFNQGQGETPVSQEKKAEKWEFNQESGFDQFIAKGSERLSAIVDTGREYAIDISSPEAMAAESRRETILEREQKEGGIEELAARILKGDKVAKGLWPDRRGEFGAWKANLYDDVAKDFDPPETEIGKLRAEYFAIDPEAPEYTDQHGRTIWSEVNKAQFEIIQKIGELPRGDAEVAALLEQDRFQTDDAKEVDLMWREFDRAKDDYMNMPAWDGLNLEEGRKLDYYMDQVSTLALQRARLLGDTDLVDSKEIWEEILPAMPEKLQGWVHERILRDSSAALMAADMKARTKKRMTKGPVRDMIIDQMFPPVTLENPERFLFRMQNPELSEWFPDIFPISQELAAGGTFSAAQIQAFGEATSQPGGLAVTEEGPAPPAYEGKLIPTAKVLEGVASPYEGELIPTTEVIEEERRILPTPMTTEQERALEEARR